MLLGTTGPKGRSLFKEFMLDFPSSEETPKLIKARWNEEISRSVT